MLDFTCRKSKHFKVIYVPFLVLAFLALFSFSIFASSEEELELKTKIITASIYSKDAQITRRGKIDIKTGTFQLVCEDLPKKFVESSLQVEGTGSAEARIIGIDLRRIEKNEIDSPRYNELRNKFSELKLEYNNLKIKHEALKARKKLISSISSFSLDKAQDQLARETFSVQDWKTLLDFFESEDVENESKLDVLNRKMTRMYDEMKWVQSELKAMQVGDTGRKAVVIDCEVTTSGKLVLDISYLVSEATWNPEYTISLFELDKEIELTYNAKIWQATGEDWEKVSVLLSTAKPHVGASPPKLSAHYLGTHTGRQITGRVIDSGTRKPLPYANVVLVGTKMGGMTLNDGTFTIVGVPPGTYDVKVMMMGYETKTTRNVVVTDSRSTRFDFALSTAIVGKTQEIVVEAEMPQIEVTQSDISHTVSPVRESHVRGGRSGEIGVPPPIPHMEAEVSSSEFAANLQIKKPIDLETGAEPKRSLIVRERIRGKFSLYAVPRLSEHVFIEGNFKNELEVPLLAGISEIYVESILEESANRVSNFVGRERLDAVSAGQDFSLHLGIDQDIKVEHKLDRKEYLSKTGQKKQKIRYHYLIVIENFKNATVRVRLEDRIPVTIMKEIKIGDVEINPPPDEENEDGKLFWKLAISPGEKQEINVSYTVEFPGEWSEYKINLME